MGTIRLNGKRLLAVLPWAECVEPIGHPKNEPRGSWIVLYDPCDTLTINGRFTNLDLCFMLNESALTSGTLLQMDPASIPMTRRPELLHLQWIVLERTFQRWDAKTQLNNHDLWLSDLPWFRGHLLHHRTNIQSIEKIIEKS